MGTGSVGTCVLVPTQVQSLVEGKQPFAGKKIRVVACGCFHMLALTMYGEMWTWGLNFHGVFGIHSEDATLHIPRRIDRALFYGKDAVTIAVCFSHSTVVAGGFVFTFGDAHWGSHRFYTGLHHVQKTLTTRLVNWSYLRDQNVGCHHRYKPPLLFAFVMGLHGRLGMDLPPSEMPRRRESQRLKGKEPAPSVVKTQGCRASKRLKGGEPNKYARGKTCIYNGFDVEILKMICELNCPVVSKRYEGIMWLQGARVEELV